MRPASQTTQATPLIPHADDVGGATHWFAPWQHPAWQLTALQGPTQRPSVQRSAAEQRTHSPPSRPQTSWVVPSPQRPSPNVQPEQAATGAQLPRTHSSRAPQL